MRASSSKASTRPFPLSGGIAGLLASLTILKGSASFLDPYYVPQDAPGHMGLFMI